FHSTDDCKRNPKNKNSVSGYTPPKSLSQPATAVIDTVVSALPSSSTSTMELNVDELAVVLNYRLSQTGRADWEDTFFVHVPSLDTPSSTSSLEMLACSIDLFPDSTTSLPTPSHANAIDPLAPGPDFPSTSASDTAPPSPPLAPQVRTTSGRVLYLMACTIRPHPFYSSLPSQLQTGDAILSIVAPLQVERILHEEERRKRYLLPQETIERLLKHPPHDYSLQLYERFKRALEESISLKVLPSLMDKNGAPLLTELLHMWAKYKVMVKCLGGFFLYLDRHFTDGKSAAPLRDVSVVCFHDLVFVKFYDKCRDAAIDLISEDRAEKMIDRGLLKNISSFFMEIGGQGNTSYYESFEKAIIADVSIYYSSLASEWLFRYSFTDYIRKAEWCLNQENARASQFLYQTSVEKLLQVLSSSLVLYH
ncbi:hypothetical protein RJ640_024773, partial [Escallonia rubra]